jgi:ABC-type glycerol-3-phosphate transport system permease component
MGWLENSNFKFQNSRKSMKCWLPITVRNRVALGFAGVSLVMFLIWNFLPNYEYGETVPDGIMAMVVWPQMFDPDNYIRVIKSPDVDGYLNVAACLALIQSGLVILAILPLWKILHTSLYVRLPLALVNLVGGLVVSWFVLKYGIDDKDLFEAAAVGLIALSMLTVSAAMFIFKNELGLRNEREVKDLMGGRGR